MEITPLLDVCRSNRLGLCRIPVAIQCESHMRTSFTAIQRNAYEHVPAESTIATGLNRHQYLSATCSYLVNSCKHGWPNKGKEVNFNFFGLDGGFSEGT